MNTYSIDPSKKLTVETVADILASGQKLALSDEARKRIEKCRSYLDRKVAESNHPIYGVTTGFGALCNVSVPAADLSRLQENLVKSHACGLGEPVEDDVVRLMLLLKAQSLSYGNSGAQMSTGPRLLDLYNLDILPVVYKQGSLGASGDLAPLANLCLPLLGLGKVHYLSLIHI